MRTLYYDCFSGISGDMNLGAMVDLGVNFDFLSHELSKLSIKDEFNITSKNDARKGITGTKVSVELKHKSEHAHRNFNDIREMIYSSSLSEEVKNLSISIFYKIAQAEAKVHGSTIAEVHFHEVGAVDSIVDIVGAAICINYLKVDKIICSPIELGGGFVKCEHGMIPVPSPAVTEILKEIPVKLGAVNFETTTPTGAAILSQIVDEFTDKFSFNITKTGYGVGERDTDIPNVLRVFLSEENEKFDKENSIIVECNIDDMNPEIYDSIFERAFGIGAQDVFLTPIIMKKNRPASKLSILCSPKIEELIVNLLFKETSTLGVRETKVHKKMMKRKERVISTSFGDVRIKDALMDNVIIKSKPEYDDIKRLAKEKGTSVKAVYDEVLRISLTEGEKKNE